MECIFALNSLNLYRPMNCKDLEFCNRIYFSAELSNVIKPLNSQRKNMR